MVARAGQRTDHGGRRAGDRLGLEEHRLPGRGRERRLEAAEGRAPRGAGAGRSRPAPAARARRRLACAPVPAGRSCCQRMRGEMEESRLKGLAPFAELSTAERKMLARMLDELTAPAGATLVSQGDYGYEFM